MKFKYIILLLIVLAFLTNPKKSEHEDNWSEFWSNSLDQIEEEGGISGNLVGVANLLGAKDLGKNIIKVRYSNFILFSVSEAEIPIYDHKSLGKTIGCFGNCFFLK